MVIVISNPTKLQNEASLINDLFDRGMPLLHLRKPEYSEKEMVELLEGIEKKNYSKIALHQYHGLAEVFGIVRLHFNEEQRGKFKEDTSAGSVTHRGKRKEDTSAGSVTHRGKREEESLMKGEYILSTSIHALEDYSTLSSAFSYTFFGPVFDSISKPGYKATTYDLSVLPTERNIKLIGLGGITKSNFKEVIYQGFDGVGLLGSIWEMQSENTLEYIIEKCHTIVQ